MSGKDTMKPAGSDVKLTYDDFLQFPDDGKRHELIDGEHYVTPSPNTKHQQVSGNLHWLIRSYLETHPIGKVFYAPFDVLFSQFDVVEPDLLFVSSARLSEVVTLKHVISAPDLIVEIGSPSTRRRDETIKRRLYERSGVKEYWIVDPVHAAIEVLVLENGDYVRYGLFGVADTLRSRVLSDLEISLAEVLPGR